MHNYKLMDMRYKLLTIIFLIAVSLISACGSGDTGNAPTDPKELLAFLEAKIKQNPKDAELYYDRGKVLLELGEVSDAINSLKQAISLKEGEEKYHLLLADAYFRNGNINDSYSNLQDVLAINPKNVDAYMKIAEIAMYSRDYDRSLESIDKALEIEQFMPKAHYMRGYVYLEQGDTAKAVASLRKTIDLDAEYASAYEVLGLLFINRNDPLGLEYLNTAITLDPNNTVALYALALYYQDNAEIVKAESYYNKVLAINSHNSDALHNLGYIELTFKENYDKAIDYFTQALEVSPNNIEALTNRALAFELKGSTAMAREGYKTALELNPSFEPALQGLKRVSN